MTSMQSRQKRPRSRGRNSRTAPEIREDLNQSPMAHVSFSGSRHLIPERIPSARREVTVGLRIIELNEKTVDNVRQLAPTLRRLDLSSLNLARLTDDFVTSLEQLELIDLSYNDLTDESFPPSFQKLKHLREVNLHYNKLTGIPKQIKRLKDLPRLKAGHNKISSTEGLERLKRLQILVLENNLIEFLPRDIFSSLKRLEIFHCAHNKLREIHPDVRFMRQLKDIDLAGNRLTSLPPELFLLPRLEVLNASRNKITRIPTINVKARLRNKLVAIDISDNVIIKFPEHLLSLTEKLDLSKNKIRSLPLSILKKLEPGSDQQLLLGDNPLIHPPADICACGVRSIVQFFQDAKAGIKVYQGIKVLVMGEPGSGKTSLIQSLVDQQSRVTSAGEETVGVDMYEIEHEIKMVDNLPEDDKNKKQNGGASSVSNDVTTKKSRDNNNTASMTRDDSSTTTTTTVTRDDEEEVKVITKTMQIALWDFSGHPQYLYSNYFFLHDPAIVMLVFNMSTYNDNDFNTTIGTWLNWVLTKTNKLIILPVGTMADKVTSSQALEIGQSVLHLIEIHIKEYKESIEKEMKRIESMPHISTVLSEQLKNYIHLLKMATHVSDTVVTVSAQEYRGFDDLLGAIENMTLQGDQFPNVMRTIPSLWSQVENYVEDKGWLMQIPFMHWVDYKEEITKKFGMKHLIEQITQYLHDVGKVIWYSKSQHLKQFVFLRPSWLSDVIKQLFRHNLADLDYNMEESFKQNNISQDRFNKMLKQIAEEGIVDREYLRGAWAAYVNPESTKSIVEVIVILLEYFEIGYPVMKTGSKAVNMAEAIIPKKRSKSRSSIERPESSRTIPEIVGNTRPGSSIVNVPEIVGNTRPGSSRITRENSRPGSSRNNTEVTGNSRPKSSARDRPVSRSSRPESGIGANESLTGSIAGDYDKDKTKSGDKKDKSEVSLPKITKVVVPWLRKASTPDCFLKEYRTVKANPALVAIYKFPLYAPPGFFESMCVRSLKEQNNFAVLYNWDRNMYAKHLEHPYRLRLTRDDNGIDEGTHMRIELRHDEATADDSDVEGMWTVMLPYLKEVEQLLTNYQGARVERLIECPKCAHRGFLGEWLSPKDLQGSTSRVCESCHVTIATVYLIQPKEKKRVEEFLLRKLKREAEKRQAQQAQQQQDNNLNNNFPDNMASDTFKMASSENKMVDETHDSMLFDKTEPPVADYVDDDVVCDVIRLDEITCCGDINLDLDEERFLRDLKANAIGRYIYDPRSTATTKRMKTKSSTAVQTDF